MIPPAAAHVAAALRGQRVHRVDRWGRRTLAERPWGEIRDELARLGFGLFDVAELQAEVAALPIERHVKAPLSDAELMEIDRSWRLGWHDEFPDEPYPGLVEARRRIRARLFTGGRA